VRRIRKNRYPWASPPLIPSRAVDLRGEHTFMANVPESQVETAKDREEVDKLHALVVSFLARVQYNSYLDLDTTLSGVIVRGRRGTARILDPHNPNASLAC
jgi:hypothetical protein